MTKKQERNQVILVDLINTEPPFDGEYSEIPLGLLSIGSFLKLNKYSVSLIGIISDNLKKIDDYIGEETLCVGMSVKTLQISSAINLSRYVKKKYPKLKVIWGGVHPNFYPKQPLEEESVDISVYGDGEETMLEILNAIKSGKSLESIKGISFRKNNTLLKNPPNKLFDLSKLPVSDFTIIKDIEKYIKSKGAKSNFRDENYFVIQAGVGCPFNCSFCYNSFQRKRFKRDNSKIFDEIEYIQKNYNINYFRLNDEIFFDNKERIEDFIKKKKERGLKFYWEATGHTIFLKDERFYTDEFMNLLKNNGLVGTSAGAESGSIEQLKRYRKNISPGEILITAERMERLKIKMLFSFMIGAPHEKYEDMLETIRLIYKIKSLSPLYSIVQYPQIYRPYPGADLYNEAVKLGFKNRESLNDWKSVSGLTGYTSYSELPYIKDILTKIYDLLYYYKFIKLIFSIRFLHPFLKKKSAASFFCNRQVISLTGRIIRRILENKTFDNLISRKIFKRSLINMN